MWVWVDRLSGVVLDASVSAFALFALVGLALLCTRQPARRLWLARTGLVCSLALIPLIGLRLVPQFDMIAVAHETGLLPHPLLPPRWVQSAPQDDSAAVQVRWSTRLRSNSWVRGLTVVYSAGVACGVGWLALGWVVLGRLTGRAVAASPVALALYQSIPCPNLRCRPRLRVAARVRRPVLVGAFRPLILIPPELDQPDAANRLRLSLLHELAHAEAADTWFGVVGNLAQAFWFHLPPLWWVRSQMRLDQEFLADRRATLGFGPARSYASSLLDLASTRGQAPRLVRRSNPGLDGPGSALFQRILMLLRCPFPVEARPPLWWSACLPPLAALLTLGVSTVSLRPGAQHSASPTRLNIYSVPRLDLPASAPGPDGRSPVCELPIRLPARFDLTMEAWGDAAKLAQMRVAGVRLESAWLINRAISPEDWHVIRVRSSPDGIALWIDRQPVPVDPQAQTLTSWLSVEPAPDSPGHFQNLTLTW
jgi:hypothetical protein